ncbi:MAG TPA: copper amine oxidase N-terminal domain-containing protein [Candidatus Acidoferrales bacterium]|nr:copper amine oxidase N-terminal domain-containing protein [Candidatus Acidoferrales bacterium]
MTYRRPSARMLVLTAALAVTSSTLLAFSRPVDMIVDGQHVDSDVPPVTTAGDQVFVPLRSFADALGAQTSLDGTNVYVVRQGQTLHVRVGDVRAAIDGVPFTLKTAPFRVRGRVMIGLVAIARVFGVRASYDARLARIAVMTPGLGEATPAQPAQAQ